MNCNVLIVDDSPILRRAVRKVVRMAGIPEERIQDAGNGKEAIEVIESVAVDLVLLDLNMPVMDGESFIKELRSRPECADIHVVIVSTEANQARLDRLAHMGVTDRLHKPFEPEDLCRLVGRIMGVNT